MIRLCLFSFVFVTSFLYARTDQESKAKDIKPLNLEKITIQGDLAKRLGQNFNRLEEKKYQPEHVFLTDEQSGGWPGDTEGRTILGLVMDAKATGREPLYLEKIINLLPKHLNNKGYMGMELSGIMDEQQLSGNGWMLRGLCEYYLWKKDDRVLNIIKSIVNNLFLPGERYYGSYPIDTDSRTKGAGAMSGSIQATTSNWKLSSDVGCLFIGMDGLIQAYDILKDERIKEVIVEMICKFQQVDFLKIQAQTHATLSGLRGLIRFSEISGDRSYISFAQELWSLYKMWGMTENFENYNWFKRYDTWTEPCAIVDSYMIAIQLWELTGIIDYLEDAELIYYNGLAHTQRANGGFGCDNCPTPSDPYLRIHADEAHWCCTMRGGEGLGSIAGSSYFTQGDTLVMPFFGNSTIGGIIQTSGYPFSGDVKLEMRNSPKEIACIKLFSHPKWTKNYKLMINGKREKVVVKNGFIVLERTFKKGDTIELTFDNIKRVEHTFNNDISTSGSYKIMDGPLVMGVYSNMPIKLTQAGSKEYPLTPVYHLMDSRVAGKAYKKQILFSRD